MDKFYGALRRNVLFSTDEFSTGCGYVEKASGASQKTVPKLAFFRFKRPRSILNLDKPRFLPLWAAPHLMGVVFKCGKNVEKQEVFPQAFLAEFGVVIGLKALFLFFHMPYYYYYL